MSINVGINGFGRIGRMIMRAALDHPEVNIVAINDLSDSAMMGHLLKYDSTYGILDREVESDQNAIRVDRNSIALYNEREPERIPWKNHGVTIVCECTGIFREAEKASGHLTAGARKVIISAPAKNPDITIVLGVNDNQYDPVKHHIVSNASCTTNCLAPVAKVLLENFGIKSGLMTTIHSYTSDQRLLDFPHKDYRRARAAALSLVPTSTGAAKAVSLVLPELTGKLNGMAIRVPTPTVSVVDFVAVVEKSGISVTDVNEALKEAAQNKIPAILGYCDQPLVSMDFKGNRLSSIVDGPSTDVINDMVKVLSWYDNEFGYACRMVDLAAMMGSQL
ncbi:MAG: type I glyceraldehyde-3-phosphate dehydrogenase [Desulfobacterales bacterium]